MAKVATAAILISSCRPAIYSHGVEPPNILLFSSPASHLSSKSPFGSPRPARSLANSPKFMPLRLLLSFRAPLWTLHSTEITPMPFPGRFHYRSTSSTAEPPPSASIAVVDSDHPDALSATHGRGMEWHIHPRRRPSTSWPPVAGFGEAEAAAALCQEEEGRRKKRREGGERRPVRWG